MSDKESRPTPGEFVIAERKQKILDNSPLLAAFLGKVGTEGENRDLLTQKMNEYGEKFSQGLGETWFANATNPMVALASLMKIFHPEASEFASAEIRNISGQLIFIGHELANDDDMMEAFAGTVTAKLKTSKLVSKEAYFGNVKTFVETGIRSGVLFTEDLKKESVGPTAESHKEGVLKPNEEQELTIFRDFINSLDIGDL